MDRERWLLHMGRSTWNSKIQTAGTPDSEATLLVPRSFRVVKCTNLLCAISVNEISNSSFIIGEGRVLEFRKLLLVFAVVGLASGTAANRVALAQMTAGTISGVVMDASGAVVANAGGKATSEATGRIWTATSGATGEFQVQKLPAGLYAVEVSAPGFEKFRSDKISVTGGAVSNVLVKLAVQSARKVVIVKGQTTDAYKPTSAAIGNLTNLPLQQLPLSALVITRSVLDDQQSRLLTEVARNDASVGEDYAPVGWYPDFMIRGFTLDLDSAVKINGLSIAGEQLIALENKDTVEFLHGVDSDEVGVASGGGLINYVTKRPAAVRTFSLATDQRGTLYAGIDLGGFLGARQQFGLRTNLAVEEIPSYVRGANGTRGFGAVAADWKINSSTYLKGDFESQHLVQRSVGGYQLLGGTTVPVEVSPDVMLGYQWWAKPNTYDDFNTGIRLDHNFSPNWRFFVAGDYSHTLLDDNIAWPYGCYFA